MKAEVDLRSKFCGALLGTGVGDSIGELAFRRSSKSALLREIERSRQLTYTDDTAMAIGLAESLIETGGINQAHLGDTFRRNFRREPWRGYALGPPTVFTKVEYEALSYVEAARALYAGEGSFGNGAAMRVAPIGLHFRDAPDLYEQAALSATVTHAHPVGIDGAALQAEAVSQAASLNPREGLSTEPFLNALLDTARTREMKRQVLRVRTLLRDAAPPSVAVREVGQGVAVHRSQPFALYCFLRHADSFEETLFCATLHGGDRDTLGAMACALSGAYLGCDAIPAMWRNKLENRDTLEALAVRLMEST